MHLNGQSHHRVDKHTTWTQSCTHSHVHTVMYTQSCTHSHVHTVMYTQSCTQTCTQSCTHCHVQVTFRTPWRRKKTPTCTMYTYAESLFPQPAKSSAQYTDVQMYRAVANCTTFRNKYILITIRLQLINFTKTCRSSSWHTCSYL